MDGNTNTVVARRYDVILIKAAHGIKRLNKGSLKVLIGSYLAECRYKPHMIYDSICIIDDIRVRGKVGRKEGVWTP